MNYNILDFGARINTLCTERIQQAIDKAFENGGGTVLVPSGIFIVGTLRLKTNVTLHLENGAVIKGDEKLDTFKKIGYRHNELGEVTSLIYAMDAENIRITGEGLIDINGNIHFDSTKPLIPENMLDKINEEQISQCTWHHEARVTQPIFFLRCENVKIRDIKIINSPTWTITFSECKNIKIFDIDIVNHPNVPNNDGIHFCASSDIIVSGCNLNCADDCIAITSITDWTIPSENITITNCIFRSFSKALVIGYMQSIVRNVTVSNIIIQKSNRGLCIMSSEKDGLVENITYTNCIVDTEVRAGNWWGNGEPIFIMGTYHHNYEQDIKDRNIKINVKNIKYSNIICSGENCIGIIGVNKNISDISFRDIKMSLKESKNLMLKGKITDLSPSVQIDTIPNDDKDYWLVVRDSANITFDNVTVDDFRGVTPEKCIADCSNVKFQ